MSRIIEFFRKLFKRNTDVVSEKESLKLRVEQKTQMEINTKPFLPVQSFGGFEEGLSVQGASHIKHNKVCQDFGGHYRCDDYAMAVVCDGHGGDAYVRSDRGSKFGVQAAMDAIKEFMNDKQAFLDRLPVSVKDKEKDSLKPLERLIQNIILRWNNSVEGDLQQHLFAEEELDGLSEKYKTRYTGSDNDRKYPAYGTTLMAVVYTTEFWFGIRIGDGKCVAISKDGTTCDPIPWDEKCFLNRTTSLCDDKAYENFRCCFHTGDFPAAIYVATDGVDDSFGSDERLFDFYQRLTQVFAQTGFEVGKQELRDYLPKLTARGSGDDISISGILDMEAIKILFPEKTIAEKQEETEGQNVEQQEMETQETEKPEVQETETQKPELQQTALQKPEQTAKDDNYNN